jgi:Phospholipase A2
MKVVGLLLFSMHTLLLCGVSCGATYELDEQDLESLKEIWFNAISKKSNESLSKQSDEFKQLIDVLSKLKTSEKQQNIFRDMKNVIQRNAREKTFGIFTNFCGPGRKNQNIKRFGVFNVLVQVICRVNQLFAAFLMELMNVVSYMIHVKTILVNFEIKKFHSKTESEISASFTSFNEYQKTYPKLPKKRLYFSSLICDCDIAFYNCIKQTGSTFGELILSIYSVAQSSCFKYDYLSKCSKYDE